MEHYYSSKTNFYGNTSPHRLINEFGSPLYVYNEDILRERCREMANLVDLDNYKPSYSMKANGNLELLKIIRQEGLHADAMSPGEIYILLRAGFKPEEIFYVCNNVSEEEMKYAINNGIMVSVDSVSQLEMYGKINPGGDVAIRINPGIGAGHHIKVITGGKNTKFGINTDNLDTVKKVLKNYNLNLVGINQHIGSDFMEVEPYVESVKLVLKTAKKLKGLKFIDFGGGFGIPYYKQDGQTRLNLDELRSRLTLILGNWAEEFNSDIKFRSEPGRYITAECGILIGTVNAIKKNNEIKYIGTDIGFNVLMRPVMYNSHHDVELYKTNLADNPCENEKVTIVGNICESGDIIANSRVLPKISQEDLIGVIDAGAYGYSMSSNYNNRLRPAEILIRSNGEPKLIRQRDKLESLLNNFE